MPTDRGEARRLLLLDAAVRVVAATGLRGLTHRAVDAGAGMPEGTTSAYFRTRLALLTALTDRVATRLLSDVEQLAASIAAHAEQAPGDHAFAIAETQGLVRGWLADPTLLSVRFELSLEAARQPDLAAAIRPWRDHLHALIEARMELLELDDPALRAATAVAAIEGLLVNALGEPADQRTAIVERQTALLLAALIGA